LFFYYKVSNTSKNILYAKFINFGTLFCFRI